MNESIRSFEFNAEIKKAADALQNELDRQELAEVKRTQAEAALYRAEKRAELHSNGDYEAAYRSNEYKKAETESMKAEFIANCEICNVAYTAHNVSTAVYKEIQRVYADAIPDNDTCDAISAEIDALRKALGYTFRTWIRRKEDEALHMYYIEIKTTARNSDDPIYNTTIADLDSAKQVNATTRAIKDYSDLFCFDPNSTQYFEDPEKAYERAKKASDTYQNAIDECKKAYSEYQKYAPQKYCGENNITKMRNVVRL